MSNARIIQDVKVPFDVLEHPQMAGRSQLDFSRTGLETVDMTTALKADEQAIWETIFNLSIQVDDKANRRRAIARFFSTNQFSMEPIIKSWLESSTVSSTSTSYIFVHSSVFIS